MPPPGCGRASLRAMRLILCERASSLMFVEPILGKRIEVYINLLYPCCDDRRNRGVFCTEFAETNKTNIRYYFEEALSATDERVCEHCEQCE